MKPTSLISSTALALLALGTACAPSANEIRHWPKPTPPPDASPIYHDVAENMPGEEEMERQAREHPAQLENEIHAALLGNDAQRKETAFVFLLPELLPVDSQRLVDLRSRLEPGDAREILSVEMARQWAARDLHAAVDWMKTLPESERRAAAVAAVMDLAPWAPLAALKIVEQFGLVREPRLLKVISSLRH